jgi:hypothetical protein
MNRRFTLRIALAAGAVLSVLATGIWLWLRAGSPVALAESAMRVAFKAGWAGTNDAHQIVRQLPTRDALRVLAELLLAPEPRAAALYRGMRSKLPTSWQNTFATPPSPGPVEFCAYQWLGEALTRTNVSVEPLLPLLEEKPDLFWNILPAPLIAHLKLHQEDVRKLIPLLRHPDFKVVNVVSHLVANSDAGGVSEPEFRWLLTEVSDEWVGQMARGLVSVARRPKETSDWLWNELERQGAVRGRALLSAVWLLEMRGRREDGLLASKLTSTNAMVRLAALHVAQHPSRSEPVFEQVKGLAIGGNTEERTLALRACGLVARSSQRPLAVRMEAARVVRESGDARLIESVEKDELPDEVKAALAGLTGR